MSLKHRKPWTVAGVVAAVVAITLVAVPREFAASEWQKTYCRLCGATREVVVKTWLWGAIESTEPRVEPAEPMGTWVGPHTHDWVNPPHVVFPDEEEWTRARKLHDMRVELVYNHLWPDPAETIGESVLRGLAAHGRDRAASVWQALIDPDRYLPFGAVQIFGLAVSPDSQWALWQQLLATYRCRGGHPVRCGLIRPEWMQLRLLSPDQRTEFSIDWSRWTFGLPPPRFLFGVERDGPEDAADSARGRALARRALARLGVDDPDALPATVRLASKGWSDTPDGRMDWAIGLHADNRAGVLLLEARRGEDAFVARYDSGEGGWRQRPGGHRQPLEPNLHHGLDRLLRSTTTAQWLARALREPDAQLRPLGTTTFAGEPAERLLVTLDGRYTAELYIGKTGRVLADRGWLRTEFGMDMVTRVNEEWATCDDIEVATRWHLHRDGAAGLYSSGVLDTIEWNAAMPADPKPR